MKKFTILLLSFILCGSMAFSQSFSTSTIGITESTTIENRSTDATYFLTHSTSQSIIQFNSVSCNAGGLHTNNSYFRVFDLANDFGINESIDVESVDFGVEQATGATGSQPITVNIYTLSGPLLIANLTLVGTQR